MDKKELLAKFEEKYEELRTKAEEIHGNIVLGKEDDEERFVAYEEAAKRNKEAAAILDNDLHKMYEEQDKLTEQLDVLDNEVRSIASDVVKEMKEKSEELNKSIELKEKHIEVLNNEIAQMEDEINSLKDSEEYKSGDEETVLKVEDLEAVLSAKISRRDDLTKKIEKVKEEVQNIDKEVEEYIEKYDIEDVDIAKGESKEQTETEKEDKETEKENKNKGKASKVVVTPISSEEESKDKKEETKEDETKALKEEFNALYKKAKSKEPLSSKEYTRLVEIMQDKENYKKLNITTGVIFNKSKVILKALSRTATITAPTVRNVREKLGMKIEKATEKNGMMSTDSIRSWSGLKELAENTDTKVASEKLFEDVVKMDRATLTEEQQEVWDNAKRHLDEFNGLKSVLNTYSDVVETRKKERMDKINNFLSVEDVKALDSAKENVKTEVAKDSLDLSGLVEPVGQENEVKAKSEVEQTREER